VVDAVGDVGRTAELTAGLVVDRTLAALAATPPVFSPNGDGMNDTIAFGFTLGRSVPVQVVVQSGGVTAATVFSGQLGPGAESLSWDGTSNGVRLADGAYVAVVTATDPLGTVSLLVPFTIDTTPPALTAVNGAALQFTLSEAATVTAVVNGQTSTQLEPAGSFTLPWTGGAVTSYSLTASDAAGNVSPALTGP